MLGHGGAGERYFLVDDRPTQWSALQTLTARTLGVTPKSVTLPRWLVPILLGRIMAETFLDMDAVLSNAKLKALDFDFEYPTIETGIPAVVTELGNARAENCPRRTLCQLGFFA